MPARSVHTGKVIVVANSRETLDGLHSYLANVGVASQTRRTLGVLPPSASAVVLFPDEMDAQAVVSSIETIRASRPELQLIVVTSIPQRYRPALDADVRSKLPIVLQKPVFGWAIVDALRAHASAESP